MEPKRMIKLLFQLEDKLYRHVANLDLSNEVDIRPHAEELGLDLDEVMAEVGRICKTRSYQVGGHMDCTRVNVLPDYVRNGSLVMDKDHLEGLRQILKVEHGIRKDY